MVWQDTQRTRILTGLGYPCPMFFEQCDLPSHSHISWRDPLFAPTGGFGEGQRRGTGQNRGDRGTERCEMRYLRLMSLHSMHLCLPSDRVSLCTFQDILCADDRLFSTVETNESNRSIQHEYFQPVMCVDILGSYFRFP